MSLAKLCEIAKRTSEYISFDSLEKKTHRIIKTSTMETSKFDKKQRLCLHLKNGYVILPQRFNEVLKKRAIMKELNSGTLALVYNGKEDKRLLITFEKYEKKRKNGDASGPAKKKKKGAEEESSSDSDDDDDDEEPSDNETEDEKRQKEAAAGGA